GPRVAARGGWPGWQRAPRRPRRRGAARALSPRHLPGGPPPSRERLHRDIPGRSAHWRWRRLLAAVALVPLALAAGVVPAEAQGGDWRAEQARYRNHARLTRAIDSLRRAHPQLIQVSEIATSPGGRAVHAVRIGT